MSAIFSKRCRNALQAVLYLSTIPEGNCVFSSEISRELDISKEFVSKILQELTFSGIIYSQKGKKGGFRLGKPASQIRLIDIVTEIEGKDIFHNCVLGFKGCSVSTPCPVHEKWGKLREETYNMLNDETLEDLRDKTKLKIDMLLDEST